MNLKNPSIAGAVALLACSVFALSGAMVFSSLGNTAQAGVGGAASAVASAAVAQGGGEPTIVWYGVSPPFADAGYPKYGFLFRSWSDGRVEAKPYFPRHIGESCVQPLYATCDWVPFSNPNDGLAAFADLNGDQAVNAQDLAQVLSRWGDAPRNDIPPSDCPLNLVNP
jgi:hypothetical protein